MKISISLLIITSIVSFSAFSTNNISTKNYQLLLSSCQALTTTPEKKNAKECIYFIEGFLAAAQTIDPPVINNQSEKKRKSFRAISRPYRSWSQISSTRYLPFCVPDNVSKARLIKTVSKQMSTQIDTAEMLKKEILRALKSEYPCAKINQY